MIRKIILPLAGVAVICYFFSLFELALGLSALIIFIGQIYYLSRIGKIISGLLTIFFALGTVFCWVLGFLVCLYLLPRTGYAIGTHTVLTMVLVNLSLLGGFLGTFLGCLALGNHDKESIQKPSEETVKKGLLVTVGILVVWMVLSYAGGILSWRTTIGTGFSVDSLPYFTSALASVQYLFFFFLGAYMKEPFWQRRNIIILIILLILGILFALPGGRETSLRIIFIFLAGVFFSDLKLKNFRLVAVFFTLLTVVLVFTIGYVRSYGDFTEKNIHERLDLVVEVIKKREPLYDNQYDNPLYSVFTRIAEPSGQIVIDNTSQDIQYAGFVNFDRLSYLYTPKFLDESKPSIDDGAERLYTTYNVPFSEYSSSPITLLADSFARWGYFGVFVVSLIISFILLLVGNVFFRLKNKLLGAILLIYFSSIALRFYALSVLGSINAIAYIFPRDFIIIVLVVLIISVFNSSRKR